MGSRSPAGPSLKKLVIDDFRGGRNTLRAMDVIAPNEASAQQNTWAEFGSLTQRRGYTVSAISISTAGALGAPTTLRLKNTQLGSLGLTRLAFTGGVAGGVFLYYTDDGSTFAIAGYTDGTISISGSTVTGSGTSWSTHLSAGDYIIANSIATKINSVDSDTQVTLASAPGNLGGGTSYIAAIDFGNNQTDLALFDVSSAQNLIISSQNKAYRWTGTTMRRLDVGGTGMTKAVQIIVHKNYVFGISAVLASGSNGITWSNLKDVTTWAAANSQTVSTVGDPIMGGIVYADSLILWSARNMYRVFGDTFDPSNVTYSIQRISTPQGVWFPYYRVAVVHNGILKFLTSDGFYAYHGGPSIQKISLNIQPDIDGFVISNQGFSYISNSAIVWKGRAWFACGSADRQIYLHDENGKWWKWAFPSSILLNDFEISELQGTSAFSLYAANSFASNMMTMDVGNTDNSTAIAGTFDTKEFAFDHDVTFSYARIKYKSQSAGNLVFGYSIDRRSYITKNLDQTSGAGTLLARNVPIGSVGKAIRLQLSNSTNNQTFEVYSIELYYEDSEAMRA